MAVTIRDIASTAGVSTATVSRALSGSGTVSARTRGLVESVAHELGYRPLHGTDAAGTPRAQVIGLIVPDLDNPFFASMCKGIQNRARAAGFSVFIADSDEDPSLEAELGHRMSSNVDGLILASARGSDDNIRSIAAAVPVVLLNRRVEGVASIVFDSAGGTDAAMRHLIALGHRSIAYAAGPAHSWSNRERSAAIAEFRASRDDLEVIDLGAFPPSFAGGREAADIAVASGATAVLAYNDLMALGLLERLRQRGISVPQQMSVMAFDNIPASNMVWPTLTSIDNPRIEMGRACVDALLDTMLDDSSRLSSPGEVPVHLVVRESTGVAPVRAADMPSATP
ncbi:LacI family DNA-binding transcriptional regulator [Microbacterium sp. A84]|uniref:LacI family DNA-binding transcriptional regulator n=1 Tax=Microbacterium sp. A84 TaxID=3450715 RepID=UPI003F43CEC1